MAETIVSDAGGRLFQAYLAEYSTLRSEILSSLDGQRQLLGLELGVIAVAISGVTFLQAQPALYLFGALLLGLLSWLMAEHTLKIQVIYRYLSNTLAAKMRGVVDSPEDGVWYWHAEWFSASPRMVALAVLASAKFILGFLLAIAFCALFAAAKGGTGSAWTAGEILVFAIDIVVLGIPALLALVSVSGMVRQTRSRPPSGLPPKAGPPHANA